VRKGKRSGEGSVAPKELVLGMIERGGNVPAIHTEGRGEPELQRCIREHVEAGSAIFSDELDS
jgi:hypothetical protein